MTKSKLDRFQKAKFFAIILLSLNGRIIYAQAMPNEESTMQFYGLIGTYASKSKISSQSSVPFRMQSGGLTTSYFGIAGHEYIGSGNKIIFSFESFFRPTIGEAGRNATDAFFQRNAYVGFSNNAYGTFKFGQQTNQTYVNQTMLNPFGSSVVFSPLIVASYTAAYSPIQIGDTVWARTIGYFSPPIGGISGAIQYSTSDGSSSSHDNIGVHLIYKNGSFQAALSAQRVRGAVAMPGTEQYLYLGGATYDAKFAKFYGALQTTNNKTARARSHTYELGLSVPVTTTSSILTEWARTKKNSPIAPNNTRNTISLGYDYSLSKRSDIYVVYMTDKLTGNTRGNTLAVGFQHKF